MKKNYKRVLGYALIMIACVLAIVFVASLSENRLEDYQEEYDKNITLSQKQISGLEKQLETLEKENRALKKKLETNLAISSDAVTTQQALSDLKEIYADYKSGKISDAKAALKKIEPMGFDDAVLSYYEILSDILKNE